MPLLQMVATPRALLVAVPLALAGASAQEPQLLAHYPLTADLQDAAQKNPPMQAANAPLLPGKGIFCNGIYTRNAPDGCDVSTPNLASLNLSAFTISVRFLAPKPVGFHQPVFVADAGRFLSFELRPGGTIALRYNNSQEVPCSVKYRIGAWHEAAITFDGDTITLYLDGAAGCRAKGPLRALQGRFIRLTNFGNATTFYGVVRDLKIYNGVVVPPVRTPEADAVAIPSAPNLAPVDLFLERCPTREQIASIDADLRLRFEADPTAGDPLSCTAAAGSRDLTPMKKRVYNTLLVIRQLQFDRPLPWTKLSLYEWLTRAIRGIRFRDDIKNSSCCDPGRVINLIASRSAVAMTDRWVEPTLGNGLDVWVLLLLHEARHADGFPHTCGTKDQTLEELGAWGVQYYLAQWLAHHTDQAFFSSGPIRHTDRLLKQAEMLRKNSFCRPGQNWPAPPTRGSVLR
jgi:hypothetical protein